MSDDASSVSADDQTDSLYVHARRESIVLLVAFGVCMVWSVSTCYWLGYDVSAEELQQTVLGMPRWVFWGIAVPWLASNIFTVIFCLFYMQDDPLGPVHDEDPA